MKKFIKEKLREEIIDGQEMSPLMQKFCNTAWIPSEWINNDYDKTIELIIKLIGPIDGINSRLWKRLETPLKQWKQQEISVNQQIIQNKMSGSSNQDNNSYWSLIQSTICEQGPDFE